MKICLVCSHGGHLTEMLQLLDAFKDHEVFLITHDEKFTRVLKDVYSIKIYLIRDLLVKSDKLTLFRILIHLLIIFLEEIKIFIKEKPDVIVSTGSEIAIPISYLAKILGKKVIFIESLCRVYDLSGTGKLVYPIADLFLVQWNYLTEKYKKARYEGKVI